MANANRINVASWFVYFYAMTLVSMLSHCYSLRPMISRTTFKGCHCFKQSMPLKTRGRGRGRGSAQLEDGSTAPVVSVPLTLDGQPAVDRTNYQKLAELEVLDTFKDDKKVKNGADLRKQLRQQLKQQRLKSSLIYAEKKKQKQASSDEAQDKVRFKLGNGFDVLTSKSLMGLIKSTAGYYFPETSQRIVLEDADDDDFYNDTGLLDDDDDDDDSANSNSVDGLSNESSSGPPIAQLAHTSDGWLKILRSPRHPPNAENPTPEQRIDYFALCMAAHFSTVATYVPTDVDSKIRGHCWCVLHY